MAINEQTVTGRKFRKLVDESAKLWQRISFWTKAVDIEFNDGKTGETKLGAIDGITDSLASTSSRIAASAKAVNSLNSNLAQTSAKLGGCTLQQSGSDFYIVGADSVRKKLGDPDIQGSIITRSVNMTGGWNNCTGTLPKIAGYKLLYGFVQCYNIYTDHYGANLISIGGSVNLSTGVATAHANGNSLGAMAATATGIYIPA